ncbi:MAG: hypothetical protein MHPSP_000789, partial [Paramarteilia canceri]
EESKISNGTNLSEELSRERDLNTKLTDTIAKKDKLIIDLYNRLQTKEEEEDKYKATNNE